MIDIRFQDFIAYVQSKIPGVNEQQKAVSIAAGVAIARALPSLPTMDSELHHYDTVVSSAAHSLVSQFNENFVINTDLALETCRAFWLMRQAVLNCHNDSMIIPNGNGTFIEKVFGLNVQANPKTIEFVNRNSVVMSTIVNRISFLLSPAQAQQ